MSAGVKTIWLRTAGTGVARTCGSVCLLLQVDVTSTVKSKSGGYPDTTWMIVARAADLAEFKQSCNFVERA